MKKLVIIVCWLTCCLGAIAQEKSNLIEIKPDKKIIHVDQLGMGENTAILDVLETMPELLERLSSDGSILSRYSIQVDGKDVGQSRDVVLEQTIIAEVDVVEVSTSPTASEQKNGTGGVINIKLKPVGNEGVSGVAILNVATSWDVQPSVLLNYKKDKFVLRSSLRAEYYRPTRYGASYLNSPDSLMYMYDTTRASFKQETAKIYMVYNPTGNDELKIHAWESYGRSHEWADASSMLMKSIRHGGIEYQKLEQRQTRDLHEEELTAEAFVGYKHTYVKHEGEFKIEAQYSYMPKISGEFACQYGPIGLFGGDVWDSVSTLVHAHQVSGEISSKHVVYDKGKDKLDLKYGVNTSYSFGDSYNMTALSMVGKPIKRDTIQDNNAKIYASPYTEMNYSHGVWDLQVGLRYQYYRVNLRDKRTTQDYTDNHTFTGNVSLRCQVAPNHHLRLNMARNINRVLNVDNIDIHPYYDADLNYIFHWNEKMHHVTMSVGANYVYAQRAKADYTGMMCAYTQLIYQYGIFSMAFAGNVYIRNRYINHESGKRYWYYNMSLLPVLSFRKQWTLSGKVVYNSEVLTSDYNLGNCVYTQIRVAKQIKGWNVYLELDDIFDYLSYNTYYLDNGMSYKNLEDVYPRNLKVGFSYTF